MRTATAKNLRVGIAHERHQHRRSRWSRPQCTASSEGHRLGVVLVDHGSRKAESNNLLVRLAELYKEQTQRRIVHHAHMELAAPTIADAFDACVSDGATTVVVSPYFLSPGRHWQEDLPQLTAAAAAKHPGVRYFVSAPLGLHPLVIQVLDNRLETCLAHATRGGPACDICVAGVSSCKA